MKWMIGIKTPKTISAFNGQTKENLIEKVHYPRMEIITGGKTVYFRYCYTLKALRCETGMTTVSFHTNLVYLVCNVTSLKSNIHLFVVKDMCSNDITEIKGLHGDLN